MKKNLIYLLFSVTLLCAALTACSDNDDLDSTSVVRPTTTEQNDLDRWLKRNYVETYNIQLKYRFEDIESSMGYYLTPASYKQSVAMAKLVRHMCLEAYDEITGSTDFIKAYFPKILFLVGSYAYKTNGAMVLGTAEAGAKITLYNLDNLNPKTVNAKTAYFKTIHHEFGHILNQTPPISRRFPARITYRTNASKSTRPPNRHCKKDSFPRMHRKPTARISWNSSPSTSTGAQKSGRRC